MARDRVYCPKCHDNTGRRPLLYEEEDQYMASRVIELACLACGTRVYPDAPPAYTRGDQLPKSNREAS